MKTLFMSSASIVLLLIIILSTDITLAEDDDWYDDRGDVKNSGYKNSTGVIDDLIERYTLTEEGIINFQPLVVDLSGDG